MDDKVWQLLLEGEAMSARQIGDILGATEGEAEAALARLREQKKFLGWRPVLNPAAYAADAVQALIEVKVAPERDGGFNRIAERISRFDEVRTCYLMSGGYDLLVTVVGDNLLAVATFVAEKLSTLGGVTSTATRFMLRSYKESGFLIGQEPDNHEKPAVSP